MEFNRIKDPCKNCGLRNQDTNCSSFCSSYFEYKKFVRENKNKKEIDDGRYRSKI